MVGEVDDVDIEGEIFVVELCVDVGFVGDFEDFVFLFEVVESLVVFVFFGWK